jgi:hypothetical protein
VTGVFNDTELEYKVTGFIHKDRYLGLAIDMNEHEPGDKELDDPDWCAMVFTAYNKDGDDDGFKLSLLSPEY